MAEFGARTLNAEAILKLVDKTHEGLRSAEKNLTGFEQRMQARAKRLAVIGGALTLAVTAPIAAFLKEGVKDALEEDKALRRIEQTVGNVGRKMGLSFGHMRQLAEELSDNTASVNTFGDVMENNIGVLLKFGNIHGKTFDRAVKAAQNASAALGEPMDAMADVIGRSLNAPLQGMRQLRTLGVAFSAEETKRIQMLVNSRQIARAQIIILGALERKYHDAARAFAKTDAGRMEQVTKNFKEFRQNLGFRLLPILEPLIKKLQEWSNALKNLPEDQQKLVLKIGLTAAAIGPAIVALGLFAAAISRIRTGLLLLGRRIPLLLLIASAGKAIGQEWGTVSKALDKANKSAGDAADALKRGDYGAAAVSAGQAWDAVGEGIDAVFARMIYNIPIVGRALAKLTLDSGNYLKQMGLDFSHWGETTAREINAVLSVLKKIDEFTARLMGNRAMAPGQHHPGKGYSGPAYQRQKAMETERNFMTPLPIEGRAKGGRVAARQTVVVGERGIELFQPDVSGTVIPNPSVRDHVERQRKHEAAREVLGPRDPEKLERRVPASRASAPAAARTEAVARGLAGSPARRAIRLPEPPPPPRAAGGRVSAGQTVKVGERGLELFRPDAPGTIEPNSSLRAASTRADRVAKSLERVSFQLEALTGLLRQTLLRGSGMAGGGGGPGTGPGLAGSGVGQAIPGGGSAGGMPMHKGAVGRMVPQGHHPAMADASQMMGAGGKPGEPFASNAPMTPVERNALGLILKYESHGKNVMNYVGRGQGIDPQTAKGYTAQGYYQMLNSNWRRLAPKLGIKTPNALASSFEDQTKVALALMRESGIKNWANFNPALRSALTRGEQAKGQFAVSPTVTGVASAEPGAQKPTVERVPLSPGAQQRLKGSLEAVSSQQARVPTYPKPQRRLKGDFGPSPQQPQVRRNIEAVASQERARQNLETMAAADTGDSSAAARRGINIGKGQLDVNLQITGQPATVKKLHVKHPENLQVMTGVDTTGSRNSRPGGLIGAI